jgi:hypothetical protein
MKITKKYSHFGGEEYLMIQHKQLYDEVITLIAMVDYSSVISPKTVEETFSVKKWNRRNYTSNEFIKDQIALAIHFEGNPNTAFDIISTHLLRYYYGEINVGIEIFPTDRMKAEISSIGVSFEDQVHAISINGRSNLPVPLLILGIQT